MLSESLLCAFSACSVFLWLLIHVPLGHRDTHAGDAENAQRRITMEVFK